MDTHCVMQDMYNVSSFARCLGYEARFAKIPKENLSGNIINVFGEGLWITQGRCKEGIIKATLAQKQRKETRFGMKRCWS